MSADSFLVGLGRVSAQAGVLVLLVLLVQGTFRKQLTPRWRCALWFIVMARLLVPFSPKSATSIFNLAPRWQNRAGASSDIVRPLSPEPPPATRAKSPARSMGPESTHTREDGAELPAQAAEISAKDLPAPSAIPAP